MDVNDDDEYMNAADAHAAFVMTVSAARMYWLLRHAQHVRDISSTHFPKKIVTRISKPSSASKISFEHELRRSKTD